MILAAVESAEPRDGIDAMADKAARDAEEAFGFIAAVVAVRRPGQRRARGTHPRRLGPDPRRAARRRRAPRPAAGEPARDADLGARRPDAPRPVCQRDRCRDPQRRAVQPGPGPEPAAPPAERGQGRLPARRQPQPADAVDLDPVERRCAARPSDKRPAPDDHLGPGRPADADGPAAAARRPARVAAAPADRRRPRHRAAGPACLGRPRRSPTGRSACTTARPTGWRSPTATSSTRSSGRSSTTPSSTDKARSPSRSASTPPRRILWTTVSDGGRGLEESDRAWLFGRFERGAAGRTSGNGSGLGLYVSRALMRGMGGDLVLDDVVPGAARRSG